MSNRRETKVVGKEHAEPGDGSGRQIDDPSTAAPVPATLVDRYSPNECPRYASDNTEDECPERERWNEKRERTLLGNRHAHLGGYNSGSDATRNNALDIFALVFRNPIITWKHSP